MNITASPDIFHVQLVSSTDEPTVLQPLDFDPEDFVVDQLFNVVGLSRDIETPVVLGSVQVQNVLLGQALNARMPWDSVMDKSQDLYDIYVQMFDEEQDLELNAAFDEALGGEGAYNGLTYLPSDEILDFNWGPTVLHMLIQHSSASYFVVGVSGLVHAESDEEAERGAQRASTLEAMGFTRFEDGPFFYLSLALRLSDLPEELELNSEVALPQD